MMMTSHHNSSRDAPASDKPRSLHEIQRAITQLELAIDSASEGSNHAVFRAVHRDRLADLYYSKYRITEDDDDLEAVRVQSAIAGSLGSQASAISPPGHSRAEQWYALQGSRLMTRYERFLERKDLDDAIIAYEKASEMVPEHSALRSIVLMNQANCLCTRYESGGHVEDIDKAIRKARDALVTAGTNSPTVKNDLSTMHLSKFEREGTVEDLIQAVALAKDAVEGTPEDDHRLPTRLLNLANSLNAQYGRNEEIRYIQEAISALKKAEHVGRASDAECLPQILSQLAHALYERYSRDRSASDLSDALSRVEEALQLMDEDEDAEPRNRLTRLLQTCNDAARELEDSADEQEIPVEA